MAIGTIWFFVFVNSKKILPSFFAELDFNLIVEPEFESELLIQLPAELIVLHGCHDSKEMGIIKKIIGQLIKVQS